MPEIKMDVIHWIFQQCHCPECGESVKVGLPAEACFDQRHTPLIAQLRGFKAMSRKDPVSFAKRSWVSDHPRHDPENCRPTCQVDQTSRQWHHHGGPPKRLQLNRRDLLVFKEKVPQSLWAMVIERVAYFGIGVHRSKEDFHHQLKDGGEHPDQRQPRAFLLLDARSPNLSTRSDPKGRRVGRKIEGGLEEPRTHYDGLPGN